MKFIFNNKSLNMLFSLTLFLATYCRCQKNINSNIISIVGQENKIFINFDTSNTEINSLKKFIIKQIAIPDSYIPLGRSHFLVKITQIGKVFKGLYFVDMSQKNIENIVGGQPAIKAIATLNGKPIWLLFSSSILRKGVLSIQLNVIQFNKRSCDTLAWILTKLIRLREDGESGSCGGDPERALELQLEFALVIDSLNFSDYNGDGFKDISFILSEVECSTGKKKNYTKTFLYSEKGFKEQTL